LEHIKLERPTRQQLAQWFCNQYDSLGKNVNTGYVRTVESFELTEESRSKLSVNHLGEEFLANGTNSILYQQLDQNYEGISDILRMLPKNPLTLDEVYSRLKKVIEPKWKTSTQCRIRINWLESLGYVSRDGPKYCLMAAGRNVIGKEDEDEEPMEHNEIRALVVELGRVLGFISEDEFVIDCYRYDAAWKILKDPLAPSHVFEIHSHGNFDRALRKLKFAYNTGIRELFLVVNPNEKLKAQHAVETTLEEIANMIKIRTPKDMKEWYESSAAASERAKTVGGYTGIRIRPWRRYTVGKRKKNSRAHA